MLNLFVKVYLFFTCLTNILPIFQLFIFHIEKKIFLKFKFN